MTELANNFAYGIEMLRLRKEREEAAETLRKQAELINLSPDAIIVRKPDGTIIFWSKGAEKICGWTKEEAVGQQIHSLFRTKSSEPSKILPLHSNKRGNGQVSLPIIPRITA